MTEMRCEGVYGTVLWQNVERLPQAAREIIAAFAEVCGEPGPVPTAPEVVVEVSELALPHQFAGLGQFRPETGPMSRAPLSPLVTMDRFEDTYFWSWVGGGLLVSGVSAATFHPGDDESQVRWMVGYLTGTLLELFGTVRACHSTAVLVRDRCYLIAGGSGSGKSTLSLLLASQGARLVSEDFSYLAQGRVLARSLRNHVTLRRGLWQAIGPALSGTLPPQDDWNEPLDRASAFRWERVGQRRVDASALFAVDMPPMLPLSAVILPAIDPSIPHLSVKRTTWAAFETVSSETRDPDMVAWPTQFFGIQGHPPCAIEPCPVFRVELTLDYADDIPATVAKILDCLATAT